MYVSKRGIDLIKSLEGFSAVPYKDVGGLLTIGFGHLVKPGEVFGAISSVEATGLLEGDTKEASDCVNRVVKVDLNQNQFDALVCFTYNLGCAALTGSTLLKLLNENDYQGASLQFIRWNKAKVGQASIEVPGLTRRRKAEQALFNEEVVDAA